MNAVTIDNKTQNALMLEVDQKKHKIEDVVAQWMKDNEATWKPWVEASKN